MTSAILPHIFREARAETKPVLPSYGQRGSVWHPGEKENSEVIMIPSGQITSLCLTALSDFDLIRDQTGSGHGWQILNENPDRAS